MGDLEGGRPEASRGDRSANPGASMLSVLGGHGFQREASTERDAFTYVEIQSTEKTGNSGAPASPAPLKKGRLP